MLKNGFKMLAVVMLVLCFVMAAPQLSAQVTNYSGQIATMTPNISYAAQTFTATGQTGATLNIGGASSGTISVIGSSLTTATWAIQGSNDGGVTFFPLLTAAIAVPGTTATSETTTANSMYIVNVAGLTNVRFVTSGTFTATNIKVKLVVSANKGLL